MPPSLHDHAVTVLDPERGPASAAPCPLCGAVGGRAIFAVEGCASPVVACPTCGLARLEPLPSDDELSRFYPDAYYGDPGVKFQSTIEWLVRAVGARHIRFLARGVPPGGRILDVGCGRGVLLAELANRGFEVHGVERTAAAALGADPRAQIRIASDLAAANYPAEFFDAVMIWHVLEHLREPVATIREIHRVLRPGGKLVVAVPNFSSLQARWAGPAWFHLDLPRHLFHFPLRALRRLLEQSGFVFVSEHHFSLRQNPFGWIQSSLNRHADLPRNGLYTLLHRRPPGETAPFDAPTRRRLLLSGLVRLPLALFLTVAEAVLRSGATVHVVARKPGVVKREA
jgi:2-polyprenyl-3-methyl-5-hydroxy-6-metoxy-1,4-benzoquinol methylase